MEEEVFAKVVHPREYYFDLSEVDETLRLLKNKDTERLEAIIDFTDFVEYDLPKSGDKLIFKYKATYTTFKDLPGNIYASLLYQDEAPNTKKRKHLFASNLHRKDVAEGQISFVLDRDLNEVKLKLEHDESFKSSKVYFDLEKVIDSTDTKAEKKALEKAEKKGWKIVNKETEIVDDYVRKLIKPAAEPEEAPATTPAEDEPAEAENNSETAGEAPEVESEVTEDSQPEESQETEGEAAPADETEGSSDLSENPQNETDDDSGETPEKSEQEAPKTPEEIIAEQQRLLEIEQAKLAAAQAKLEAEKAMLEAERQAKEKEEQERLAKEAQMRAEQQERERQENELLEHQKMLEETIQVVTSSNIQRYEKEYLNDYIVSGYSFDIEEEETPKTPFVNPNKANESGRTLLMDAAKEGNDWKIKALIAAGADVNMKDSEGWTALMYAVRYNGNMNCVELLLESGADVKAENNYGMTALILTANYNSNPEILRKLLEYYSPTEKDVLQSFIQVLTENQDDEYMQIIKVNLFLDKSVPLNSFYYGKTPLMYAAESGRSTKIIKLLLNNSNTAIRSKDGKTAFDYAKENPKLAHDDIYWSLNNK